jgi:hypothetical protein
VPCGLVAIHIARMAHRWSKTWSETWGDTPKPTPAQLTRLRNLQSDLGPFLASIDAIPYQTDDPALTEAAERVHDALSALLAEMAVVIYRAKQGSRHATGDNHTTADNHGRTERLFVGREGNSGHSVD